MVVMLKTPPRRYFTRKALTTIGLFQKSMRMAYQSLSTRGRHAFAALPGLEFGARIAGPAKAPSRWPGSALPSLGAPASLRRGLQVNFAGPSQFRITASQQGLAQRHQLRLHGQNLRDAIQRDAQG